MNRKAKKTIILKTKPFRVPLLPLGARGRYRSDLSFSTVQTNVSVFQYSRRCLDYCILVALKIWVYC